MSDTLEASEVIAQPLMSGTAMWKPSLMSESMSAQFFVDCDPGHDDAIALAVAAHRGQLLGVTTVAGNVAVEQTTINALTVLQLLGSEVEVHSGAAVPLNGQPGQFASFVHGDNGLVGAVMPELTRSVASDDAAGYLIEATREHQGAWILAIGPMTNLAHALQRDPSLVDRIAGITMMGGGTYGNITAAAEFNISFDPEAADVVFRSGAKIVQCGLDLTHQLCVDDSLVAASRATGNRFGEFCAGMLGGYLANIRALTGSNTEAVLYDPCAALAVTDPELFDFAQRYVEVELTGELTRGMTLVDQRSWMAENGPVQWAQAIDAVAATNLILDAIAEAP